jgi:hypothetical protein
MRLSQHALGFVCAFGLALGVGGCTKPSTILLIEVEGPLDVNPNQLRVTVTAGIDARGIYVPAIPLDDADKMQFPTSFTISLDQSRTAPIGVSIDALDKNADGVQASIDYSGTTTYQHVEIGGQTTVTVVLTEGAAPDQPDGGVDGGAGDAGTAGSGGTGGASGAAGTGGVGGAGGAGGGSGGAGAGGAAGRDAAADEASDAGLGLDGAAD